MEDVVFPGVCLQLLYTDITDLSVVHVSLVPFQLVVVSQSSTVRLTQKWDPGARGLALHTEMILFWYLHRF